MSINVTEAQKRAAQDAVVQEANTAEAWEKLKQDVANLIKANHSIREKFIEVGIKLTELDNGRLSNGEPINNGEKFFPRWDALRRKYYDLVNTSNDTATTVGTYCKSFHEIILPFTLGANGAALTTEEKVNLLKGFKATADEFHADATKRKVEFDDFYAEVKQFSTVFQHFAEDRISQNKDAIRDTERDIVKLQEQIEALKTEIDIMIYGVIGSVVVIGAGAGLSLIFPFFGLFIMATGVAAITALLVEIQKRQDQIFDKEGEIIKLNNYKANLLAVIAQLEEAQKVLGTIKNEDIPFLTDALSAFSTVWQSVSSGCQQVSDYLVQASTPGIVDVPEIVSTYLDKSTSVYGPVGEAMLDYARGLGERSGKYSEKDKLRAKEHLPKWADVNPAVHKVACKIIDEYGAYASF